MASPYKSRAGAYSSPADEEGAPEKTAMQAPDATATSEDNDVSYLARHLANSGISNVFSASASRLSSIWSSDSSGEGSASDFQQPISTTPTAEALASVFGSSIFSPGRVRAMRGSARAVNRGLYSVDSGSGDETEGGPSPGTALTHRIGDVTESSTWKRASSRTSGALSRALLDLERPQLLSAMVDHWMSEDACLTGLLDFLVRPVDNPTHAGAGALGQDAVAALAAGPRPRSVRSGGGDAGHPSDASASASGGHGGSGQGQGQFDLSVYNLVPFGLQAVHAHGSRHTASGLTAASAGFLTPAQDREREREREHGHSGRDRGASSVSSASQQVGSLGPGRTASSDFDAESDHMGLSLGDADSTYGGDGGEGGHGGVHGPEAFGAGADAIPQAVAAAHAAAFAAAVADLRYIADSAAAGRTPPATPAKDSTAATATADAPATPATPSAAAAGRGGGGGGVRGSRFRGVSLLFPRVTEEADALVSVSKRAAAAAAAAATAGTGADSDDDDEAEAAAAAAASEGGDVTASRSSSSAVSSAVTSAEYMAAAESERAAVKRGFKLMRLLVAGTGAADELLEARAEDITKHMFNVFSSRYKGNFYHACAVLQRLVQFQPDAVAKAIASDSQRYLGAMLSYLHHAPVADTLVQIVLVSHLASAQGGAGPNASVAAGGMTPASLLGFGGPLGGRSGHNPNVTQYEGALPLYSQKGVTVSPFVKAHLYRSLAGWGFLSVLASHIYRHEYAVCPDHVSSAADAFLQIVRGLATEDKSEPLLSPLGTSKMTLRGLLAAACAPRPGVDFPLPPAPSATATATATAPASGGTAAEMDADAGAEAYHAPAPLSPLPASASASASAPNTARSTVTTSGTASAHAAAAAAAAAAATLAAPTDGYAADGVVPCRQRECMRVLAELAALAFQPQVPVADALGGGVTAVGQPVKTVENRVAKYAPQIASGLISALPRLGAALCRLHRALHPDVPALKPGKAAAAKRAGGTSASTSAGAGAGAVTAPGTPLTVVGSPQPDRDGAGDGHGGSGEGLDAAASPATAGADSDKKKRRKKKKKSKGGAGGGGGGGAGGDKAGEEGSDEEADGATATATTAAAAPTPPATPVDAKLSSATAAASPVPPLLPHSASSSAGTMSPAPSGGHGGGHGGASRPKRPEHKHPGHTYTAPFGSFRLYAIQLIAALAQRDMLVPKLDPLPLPTVSQHLASLLAGAAGGAGTQGAGAHGAAAAHASGASTSGMGSPASRSRASTLTGVGEGAAPGSGSAASGGAGGSGRGAAAGKHGAGHGPSSPSASHTSGHGGHGSDADSDGEEGEDSEEEDGSGGEGHEGGGHGKKGKKSKKGKKKGKKGKSKKAGAGGRERSVSSASSDQEGSGNESVSSSGRGGAGAAASASASSSSSAHGGSADKDKKGKSKAKKSRFSSAFRFGRGGDDSDDGESDREMVRASVLTLEFLSAPASLISLSASAAAAAAVAAAAPASASASAAAAPQSGAESLSRTSSIASGMAAAATGGAGASGHGHGHGHSPSGHQAHHGHGHGHHAHGHHGATHHGGSNIGSGGGGGASGGLSCHSFAAVAAGAPTVFDPLEFWATLVTWVPLYAQTNGYHVAFSQLLTAALKHNHEPTLMHAFKGAKLLTNFIHHYSEGAPHLIPLTHRRTLDAVAAAKATAEGRRGAHRTKDASGARGVILRCFNSVRLVAQTLPPTAFLPQHLRDHSLWAEFLPHLREDTALNLSPLVAPPPKPGSQENNTMSAFQNLFHIAPHLNAGAALAMLRSGGGAAAKKEGEEDGIEWGLGSSLAKELGLEGMSKYVDPHAGKAGAATAGAAAATAAAPPTAPGATAGTAKGKAGSGGKGKAQALEPLDSEPPHKAGSGSSGKGASASATASVLSHVSKGSALLEID